MRPVRGTSRIGIIARPTVKRIPGWTGAFSITVATTGEGCEFLAFDQLPFDIIYEDPEDDPRTRKDDPPTTRSGTPAAR